MYVLIVYDIGVERVTKVHKLLKRHLNWRQNSVFEGEATHAQIEKIKQELCAVMNDKADSVLIYIARDAKWLIREELGKQRGSTDNFI